MEETRFWLIRHAESTWNAAGRWQGQSDPPLSERGRLQAEALGQALAAEGLDLLLASDLARAAETAAIVGRVLGLEPRLTKGLREIHAGSWSGLSRREIQGRDPECLAQFLSGDPDARAGGGESRREAAIRARAALLEVAGRRTRHRVGIVTHGGVVRSLLPHVTLANAQWHALDASQLVPVERWRA